MATPLDALYCKLLRYSTTYSPYHTHLLCSTTLITRYLSWSLVLVPAIKFPPTPKNPKHNSRKNLYYHFPVLSLATLSFHPSTLLTHPTVVSGTPFLSHLSPPLSSAPLHRLFAPLRLFYASSLSSTSPPPKSRRGLSLSCLYPTTSDSYIMFPLASLPLTILPLPPSLLVARRFHPSLLLPLCTRYSLHCSVALITRRHPTGSGLRVSFKLRGHPRNYSISTPIWSTKSY